MHESRKAEITSPIVSLSDDGVRTIPIALVVGAAGLAVAFFFGGLGLKRFLYIYLVNFCFLLSICLGGLFFVTVMHLTRAGWSATVRRLAELLAMCVLPMFILSLPILASVMVGGDIIYEWNVTGWVEHDAAAAEQVQQGTLAKSPLETLKDAYLNKGFFLARVIGYFVIWSAMAYFFLSNSLKQDQSGEKSLTIKMQKWSAPLMILLAASFVFSSFDFEMSLAPLWFSTMFPVYFFAGCFLSALASMMFIGIMAQRSGRVTDEITVDHYHDLAKLTFAFIFFWGYVAFSQFMLIWYANIPEETVWFDARINGDAAGNWSGWQTWSLVLLFGHLLIPFLGLMARTVRRSKKFLLFAAVYMLVMRWVDHYWIIMPQFAPDHAFTFQPIADIACSVGMVGIFVAIFCLVAGDKPLVTLKDPRLGEALNFKNP